MTQSVAIIYIENKAQQLMALANELKEYDINLFLELVSIYTAMVSAADLVKEVQDHIYNQEIQILDMTETIEKLTDKL